MARLVLVIVYPCYNQSSRWTFLFLTTSYRKSTIHRGLVAWQLASFDLKADSARGEEASCISCYMKENPGLTEKDVVKHIHAMVDDLIKELNWAFSNQTAMFPYPLRNMLLTSVELFITAKNTVMATTSPPMKQRIW